MRQGRSFWTRGAFLVFFLILLYAHTVFAATPQIMKVRFGANDERDRIVFDVSALPQYATRTEMDGKRIILELQGIGDSSGVKPVIRSDTIKRVSYTKLKNSIVVTIDLTEPSEFVVKTLQKPFRLFIDIQKWYENEQTIELAPGLAQTIYRRRDGRGRLTAYFLDVDLAKYSLMPVLANGEVLGRATVSRMAREVGAEAAINASYFAPSGEILGMLRMDNEIVGTTYFTRSALGIRKDGSLFIAPVYYDGKVTIGRTTRPVSGINAERSENALILYNRAYDVRTNTNAFGREFLVRNGKVVKINQGNSTIPKDGYVISVHGASRDAFVRVRVGDKVMLSEDLGAAFAGTPGIVGAGPMLVERGKVHVTEEDFPGDITRGRAPRTGVAILKNRHALLAVVDGRQASSIGVTLSEFAELLVARGARDALNLDGGGSSAMVARGRLVNSPSDGEERPVGSALAVMRK